MPSFKLVKIGGGVVGAVLFLLILVGNQVVVNEKSREDVSGEEGWSTLAEETGVATSSPIVSTDLYQVVRVVDGDTVVVDIEGKKETLRLIGINTPETVDPRKKVECFGIEASAKAKAVLAGQTVRLEADPTQGERDKYGRLLRYVILPDGTNFNKLMVTEGFAYEYIYNGVPYKYQADFRLAQQEARVEKRGLWADRACIDKSLK